MPGKGAIERKNQRDREAWSGYQEERKKYLDSRLAENLTPEQAFSAICRRVAYLNEKIEYNKLHGMKFELYIREREAMFWMMDKIKELSEKLLEASK